MPGETVTVEVEESGVGQMKNNVDDQPQTCHQYI